MRPGRPTFALRSLPMAMAIAGLFAAPSAFGGGAGGEYAPIIMGGWDSHSGTTGSSITGANGYYAQFRAEKRKGFFRTEAAFDFEFASGKTSINSTDVPFTMFSGSFVPGAHFFIFQASRFEPFVGANAILGWNFMKLSSPPTGTEPQTQSISYGYEVTAGVDMRFGSLDGTAYRLQSSFFSNSAANLAGISSFGLAGFRLSIGLVY